MIQLKHISILGLGLTISLSAMAQNTITTKMAAPKSPWKSSILSINEFSAQALNENDNASNHLLFTELRYVVSPAFTFGYKQLFTYEVVRKDQSATPEADRVEQGSSQAGDGNFVTAFKKFKFLNSNAFAPEIRYYVPISNKSKNDGMITGIEYFSSIGWGLTDGVSFALTLKPSIRFFEEKDASVRFYQTGNLSIDMTKGHSLYVEAGTDTRYSGSNFMDEKMYDKMVTEIGYSGALTSNLSVSLYAGNGANMFKPQYDFMLYAYDETSYGLLMALKF